jgi:hypothetical protein
MLYYKDKRFINYIKLMKARALQDYRNAEAVNDIKKICFLATGQLQFCNEFLSVSEGNQTIKNLDSVLRGL